MKLCDWCGVEQEASPVVLGQSKTMQIQDVYLCALAINELRRMLHVQESMHIYMHGHGRGGSPPEFIFDMMEPW